MTQNQNKRTQHASKRFPLYPGRWTESRGCASLPSPKQETLLGSDRRERKMGCPIALVTRKSIASLKAGFVKIEGAFPKEIAAQARSNLWKDTGCDPDDPATWIKPVIRLSDYPQEPFRIAANTPVLHKAFDQLVGPGRWLTRESLGSFPIRFPSQADPGDTGWHIDVSFGLDNPNFMEWRANITSRGRALLMLFLFSDVGEMDAPT